MTITQEKIKKIVDEYKMLFVDEFEQFCQSVVDKREVQKDALASTGLDGAIQQLAYEVPVTLRNLFQSKLDKEEKLYLQSNLGAEWFGRTFNEFSPAEKI